MSLFYVLFLANLALSADGQYLVYSANDSWKGVLWPLNFFGVNFISLNEAFLLFVFTSCMTILFVQVRPLRVFVCLSALILFNLIFAYGKSNSHSFHNMIFFSFFLIFIDSKNITRSQVAFKYGLAMVLSHYGASGLWKVYGLLVDVPLRELPDLLNSVIANHLAYAKLEGSLKENIFNDSLLFPGAASGFLWGLVILFELAAIPAIFSRAIRTWVLKGLFLMHLFIGLIMGIWFRPAMLLLMYLYAFEEILRAAASAEQKMAAKPPGSTLGLQSIKTKFRYVHTKIFPVKPRRAL